MSSSTLFQQTLSSAGQNVHCQEWSIDSRALGLEVSHPFSVVKRTLHGGKQEGVDLVIVDNGQLKITVVPTRGMGILKVECGDLRLGWNSPVQEVVHPHHVNLLSRGGLGWLEGFNEWLVRCGLEFAGGPGKDRFVTNTGAEAEMDLTLHGKIANLPASEVQVLIERQVPHRIRLRGRVDETMFYGPKLELWTEITIEPGATTFQVEDQITNRGGTDQEFEIIYHVNFGTPLLEAGARFLGAMKHIFPMNSHAARHAHEYETYLGPTAGFVEHVYCMEPISDARGRTTVMLSNRAADRAVSMSFAIAELPCFTLWKNTNSLPEGYVTGLEPGTNFPFNRRIERQFGRLSKLRPLQTRTFRLEFGVYNRSDAVTALADQIATLQKSQLTVLDSEPPSF